MLMIRNNQMSAFREYMLKQFEDLQVTHLNRHFPEDCRLLGETGVREAIRYGIERARVYDILIEYDVSRYITLMFSFGRNFDMDANLGWASEILKDEGMLSGSVKMDSLYDEAEKHLPQVTGIRKQV